MKPAPPGSRKVLITGVAGFIGRYAARCFSKAGWSVIGIDAAAPENAPLQDLDGYYAMKLPSPGFIQILTDHPPSVCIHCAGRASVGLSMQDPSSDFYDSVVITFEILNALRQFAPECRFIFLSSAAVYGNPESLPVSENHPTGPISSYGFHKLQCEQLCSEFHRVYGLQTAIARIFSAYGPGLHRQVIWDICYKAMANRAIILNGTGRESRDFVHSADIAAALVAIAEKGTRGAEVYNIGSGRQLTIKELAEMILRNIGGGFDLSFDGRVPEGTPLNWEADITKLEQIGFKPSISIEAGIRSVVDWCRAETGVIS